MPTVTPPPSPVVLAVALTPGTRPLLPALQVCSQETPGLSLRIAETPAPRLDLTAVDLAFRLGPPDEATPFQAALGSERLQVVVHPDNPIRSISPAELAGLYRGEVRRWTDLRGLAGEAFRASLAVWTYPPGDDVRQVFDQGLPSRPGKSDGSANLAPDPAAMRQALSEDPGAIGFLPAAWDPAGLKVLPVEPVVDPGWEAPVLALTATAPSGALFDLVACLQSGPGHETLQSTYPDA